MQPKHTSANHLILRENPWPMLIAGLFLFGLGGVILSVSALYGPVLDLAIGSTEGTAAIFGALIALAGVVVTLTRVRCVTLHLDGGSDEVWMQNAAPFRARASREPLAAFRGVKIEPRSSQATQASNTAGDVQPVLTFQDDANDYRANLKLPFMSPASADLLATRINGWHRARGGQLTANIYQPAALGDPMHMRPLERLAA